jgi:hypothetical protein
MKCVSELGRLRGRITTRTMLVKSSPLANAEGSIYRWEHKVSTQRGREGSSIMSCLGGAFVMKFSLSLANVDIGEFVRSTLKG